MARENDWGQKIYWTDALCINQVNTLERNHQFVQMGQVYSRVTYVYPWLRKNPTLLPALRAFVDPDPKVEQRVLVNSHILALANCVCENEYWERAGVIQEITLGHTVLIWPDAAYIGIGWPQNIQQQLRLVTDSSVTDQYDHLKLTERRLTKIDMLNRDGVTIKGRSLLRLLIKFENKMCEVLRDRVFSLLSICGEGRELEVNYSVLDSAIALRVLEECVESLCVRSPCRLADTFALKYGFSDSCDEDGDAGPYLEMVIPGLVFVTRNHEYMRIEKETYSVRQLEFKSSTQSRKLHEACHSSYDLVQYLASCRVITPVKHSQFEQHLLLSPITPHLPNARLLSIGPKSSVPTASPQWITQLHVCSKESPS